MPPQKYVLIQGMRNFWSCLKSYQKEEIQSEGTYVLTALQLLITVYPEVSLDLATDLLRKRCRQTPLYLRTYRSKGNGWHRRSQESCGHILGIRKNGPSMVLLYSQIVIWILFAWYWNTSKLIPEILYLKNMSCWHEIASHEYPNVGPFVFV